MMVDMPDPVEQISRRVFLHGALAVASSAIIAPGPDVADGAAAKAPSQVEVQNLGGSLWRVHQGSHVDEAYPAQVPGDIFTDLLAANKIPNPYFRDNNSKVQWVGKRAWWYARRGSKFAVFAILYRLMREAKVLSAC